MNKKTLYYFIVYGIFVTFVTHKDKLFDQKRTYNHKNDYK